jgi:hypothetical protein
MVARAVNFFCNLGKHTQKLSFLSSEQTEIQVENETEKIDFRLRIGKM